MLNPIFSFFLKYQAIILFYLIIIIWLIIKRKKLDYQARIIILYRMKFGLRFIEKISKKYREWIRLLGYIGMGAGYVGLIVISYVLIKNLWDLFTQPAMTSGVSLVLPGISVPGMGVLPFWYWILAIFIIALVHEFSHGIVARAHDIPVKNTGMVFLGPIIGAFVEPNEDKLRKQSDIAQYSVLAAGSFSNILLALFALVILSFVFVPIQNTLTEPTGFTFSAYYNDSLPFAKAGIQPNTLITGINNKPISDFYQFSDELICLSPGDQVKVATANKSHYLTLAASPDNPDRGFLGIQDIKNEVSLKEEYQTVFWQNTYAILLWVIGFLRWLFLLSLGIGLFNLLPLPIVDGGRMMQVTLHKLSGEKKGERHYYLISMFFLFVLLLNLFYPYISKLF
jgi:membrane-associated protease RseP (regulator of RpoE activity)